jgi:hypothetical protein
MLEISLNLLCHILYYVCYKLPAHMHCFSAYFSRFPFPYFADVIRLPLTITDSLLCASYKVQMFIFNNIHSHFSCDVVNVFLLIMLECSKLLPLPYAYSCISLTLHRYASILQLSHRLPLSKDERALSGNLQNRKLFYLLTNLVFPTTSNSLIFRGPATCSGRGTSWIWL